MRQAVTSVVLILGQLALACAAPLYVCTSADGMQRLEWGACHCLADNHGHGSLTAATCEFELQFAEPPCQCEHRPLTEGTQVVSRSEHDARGMLLIQFAGEEAGQQTPTVAAYSSPRFASPRGHTPLVDRLSICLRC
jgi:hypothetical protein